MAGARELERAGETDDAATDDRDHAIDAVTVGASVRVYALLTARPRLTAALGAVTIAFSAILVRKAAVSPSTAAIFRCLYAIPLLLALAGAEDRRFGPRPARGRRLAAIAGILFAIDLVAWHHAIHDVGAGLATVLGNLQVAFVPVIAWLAIGERPDRRTLLVLPLMLAGIVLISGVFEHGAYGDAPGRGAVYGIITGLSYAGFILILRAGSSDLRRPAGPLADATVVATVAAVAIGAAYADVDLVPGWPEHGWLLTLALTSQVVGWMLISTSLPRLPAAITSVLLTIQPVGSVLLAIVIFSEAPTALQLAGGAAIVSGLILTTGKPAAAAAEA
jgi:drug/metabolite transporter (DMT)-like permease